LEKNHYSASLIFVFALFSVSELGFPLAITEGRTEVLYYFPDKKKKGNILSKYRAS
jgi:hypothetical protein